MDKDSTQQNGMTVKQRTQIAERKDSDSQGAIRALAKTIAKKNELASQTLRKTAEAACSLESVKDALSKETQLVVDMTEDMKKAYDEGLIKLVTNKAGEMFAQVRRADGTYGNKLSIKEQVLAKGLNPLEVQNAMRTQAIQEQLEEIVATLAEISEGVSDIKQGQHNDRIGLLLSGQALYLEASVIEDPTMRKFLEAQALKSLSDAGGQLSQSITTDIKYLAEGKYKSRKKDQKAAIEDRLSSIRNSLDAVNMLFALKAAIYYGSEETEAMLKCLEQYANFIMETVAPKSKKLAELDPAERLPKGGFWEEKALALEAVNNIRGHLNAPEDQAGILTVEAGEEENHDER